MTDRTKKYITEQKWDLNFNCELCDHSPYNISYAKLQNYDNFPYKISRPSFQTYDNIRSL